jgi:hypothetical protein
MVIDERSHRLRTRILGEGRSSIYFAVSNDQQSQTCLLSAVSWTAIRGKHTVEADSVRSARQFS